MYAFCPAVFEYNWAVKGYIKSYCVELTNQPRRLITVNIQRFIFLAHMKSTVGPGALLGSSFTCGLRSMLLTSCNSAI